MTTTRISILALALCGVATGAAQARDNDGYGETRIGELPLRGALSKTPWVGSWWAYRTDGSAYRLHDPAVNGLQSGSYATRWTRWDDRTPEHLSPAEKYDLLVGRQDAIEYDALIARAKAFDALGTEVQSLIEERRTLVRKLNSAITEHEGDSSFDWRSTDDGKRYLEVTQLIEDKEAEPAKVELTVDTAFEYEVLNHGTAQFGIASWYGHCNAWSGAAVLEPEPRFDTAVDGIPFTHGDVKAYLTEVYMELQSSFYGTRNEYHDSEEGRAGVDFRDVTPAAFHILFADLIGKRDKGFVIDRFTGSEVWNQPVRAYRSKVEPLYETVDGEAVPMKRKLTYTEYGAGAPRELDRGDTDVYPVLVTTTIHWVTDGLPHETLTRTDIDDSIDDETFASAWEIRSLWDDQIELRTLTYELWLDKPMSDPDARIVGDGKWEHGSISGFTQLQPDFIWVPLANLNNSRDYENEFYDYDTVVNRLMPGTLAPADDPAVAPQSFSVTGEVAIPDASPDEPARLSLEVTEELTVSVLTVEVDIQHTYIGDLEVSLLAPDGRVAVLKAYGDGGSADDLRQTYDVTEFNGAAALGTWSLVVRDQWKQDVGTVRGLTLHIK